MSRHRETGAQAAAFGFAHVDPEFVAHHLVQPDVGVFLQTLDDRHGFFVGEAFETIVGDLFGELFIGHLGHLTLFAGDCVLHDLPFRFTAEIFADAHRNRADEERQKAR